MGKCLDLILVNSIKIKSFDEWKQLSEHCSIVQLSIVFDEAGKFIKSAEVLDKWWFLLRRYFLYFVLFVHLNSKY